MENLCISCKKLPVYVKKSGFCKNCYQYYRRQERGDTKQPYYRIKHTSEVEFIKHFFKHKNWYYHPAIFKANGFRYEPDFYDGNRNVFIEVSASRLALEGNQEKYKKFIKAFPHFTLEIRRSNGELLDINDKRQHWPKK